MLTTHPHLVTRLRMSRSYTSSPPMRLHGMYAESLFAASTQYTYDCRIMASIGPGRKSSLWGTESVILYWFLLVNSWSLLILTTHVSGILICQVHIQATDMVYYICTQCHDISMLCQNKFIEPVTCFKLIYKGKVIPLHAMEAHGGRGGIAPHS
jgi:hypothetical protein